MIKRLLTVVLFVFLCALMTLSVGAYENFYGEEIQGCTPIERNDWYDFSDYTGYIADGKTDVSSVLQSCVNEHDNVFIPKGEYRLEAPITLHDGSGIKGEEGTYISAGGSPYDSGYNVFVASGTYNGETDTVDFATDISVKNIKVECDTPESRGFIFYGTLVRNLELSGLDGFGIGIVNISSMDVSHLILDDDGEYLRYSSRFITISDCVADGNADVDVMKGIWSVPVGMNLFIMENFIIERCTITNFCHGIQFIGGSANITDEDNYEEHFHEVGKFENGIVTDCNVSYISGGGIWGICARNFIIQNCDLQYCWDGHIDFEASYDLLIQNNYMYNGLVGGSTACMGTIIYRNNYFKSSADWPREYFTLRGSPDSDYAHYRQNYIFEGNIFEAVDKIGSVNAAHYGRAATAYYTFRNNKCINTVLRTVTQWTDDAGPIDNTGNLDLWEFTVENNEFIFDRPLSNLHKASIYALTGAKTQAMTKIRIVGNTITTTAEGQLTSILVTNERNGDKFSCIVADNTVDTIKIENISDDKLCSVCLKNNNADRYELCGRLAYLFDKNEYKNGNEYKANEVFCSDLFTLTKSSTVVDGHPTYSVPKLPDGYAIGIDGIEDTAYNSTEWQSLDKANGSDTTVRYKALWYDTGDKVVLSVLAEIEKSTEFKTLDTVRFTFEDGDGVTYTAVKFSGLTESYSKDLLDKCDYSSKALVDEDKKHCAFEIKFFFLAESEIYQTLKSVGDGEKAIGFNISFCEGNDTEKSVSWACKISEEEKSKLGKLLVLGYMNIGDADRQSYYDFNGDGKTDTRDIILMKQYLAGGFKADASPNANITNITDTSVIIMKLFVSGFDYLKNAFNAVIGIS